MRAAQFGLLRPCLRGLGNLFSCDFRVSSSEQIYALIKKKKIRSNWQWGIDGRLMDMKSELAHEFNAILFRRGTSCRVK